MVKKLLMILFMLVFTGCVAEELQEEIIIKNIEYVMSDRTIAYEGLLNLNFNKFKTLYNVYNQRDTMQIGSQAAGAVMMSLCYDPNFSFKDYNVTLELEKENISINPLDAMNCFMECTNEIK